MADITTAFQPKFENIWRRLVQQSDSRLEKAVSTKSGCTGEVEYHDQISPIEVTEITARLQATAISEIDVEKRALYPSKFHAPKHFDEFDEKLLADQSLPTSQTFVEIKSGINRKKDDLIIAAALGTAKTGVNGGTNVVLPAGQKIAVNPGGGANSNMTLDKWLDTKELFEANEAFGQDAEEMGDKAFIVLGSKQLRALYDEAKITSSDYAGELTALYRGEIDQFLGFHVIRSERLAVAANIRSCFAFVTSGIQFDTWVDPTFNLSIRNDYNDALQLRGKAQFGATRLEEKKVVEIACDETA